MKTTKIVIAIATILILSTPVVAQATSGACSYHGGVNCSAGADYDGSVVCNDGWRDSSVSYSSMTMCQDYQYSCGASEWDSLSSKYHLEELYVKMNDIFSRMEDISANAADSSKPFDTSDTYEFQMLQTLYNTVKSQRDLGLSLADSGMYPLN